MKAIPVYKNILANYAGAVVTTLIAFFFDASLYQLYWSEFIWSHCLLCIPSGAFFIFGSGYWHVCKQGNGQPLS